MGKRIYPLKYLKYWWMYDFYDICELYKKYKLHPQTIRQWIKNGLPTLKGRPTLIYGNDLIKFLGNLNKTNKCKTEFQHIFCLKCKEGKDPYRKQVQLKQKDSFIVVKAQCQSCKSIMYKSYKFDDLPKLKLNFHMVDVLELYDSKYATVKTHLNDQEKIRSNEPVQLEFIF